MSRSNRLNDLTSVVLGSSRSSFVNTICKFVRDVDEMNDTVLVPTMLTVLNDDRSSSSTPSSEPYDLQTLYQLLNRLKEELTIARFDDGKKGAKNVNSANILSAINCNNNSADNNNLNNHHQLSNNNINNNNNTNSSNNQINVPSLRIPEGADLPMSKKSCKCSDSDDGFSSLNSYSRNSDEESTIGSESECCHLLLSSSASTSQQPRLELLNGAESSNLNSVESSSPEYIVNLLRLHIQGIQSILTRFSKCADKVSESYVDNTLN